MTEMRRRHSLLDFWRGFIDSLDTGGGHIFIALFVLLVGVWCYTHMDSTAGGQVMTGAMTALWVMLKNVKSNREQLNATTSTATTTTQTQPPPVPVPPVDPPVPPTDPVPPVSGGL